MKRFERSNGLDTALYKNYLYLLYNIVTIVQILMRYSVLLSLLELKQPPFQRLRSLILDYDLGNQRPWIYVHYYFVYIQIDAGSKVKTAHTWLCFHRPRALVFSAEVCTTMKMT